MRYEASTVAHLDDPILLHVRRDYVPLNVEQTVGEALESLRRQDLGERIVYFYVVDGDSRLRGVVPTRRLLMSDPATTVGSLMVRNVITVPDSATVRDVSEMFIKHRFLAFPVVNGAGSLQGVADVGLFTDEIAELMERQSATDVFQLIGLHVARAVSPWSSFKDRFPWLLANIGGGLVAALLAGLYEDLLSAVIALALFIPVVLALAESVSMQSMTITLQMFHAQAATRGTFWSRLRRELMTAALLGLGAGTIVGVGAWLAHSVPMVAVTVGAAIALSMVTASLLGVALPTAVHVVRGDPKVAAGPIVLALADIFTLLFYFNLGVLLLV
jgi:magnesium transporter